MLDVEKRDELIQSFDDKRLRTLFTELLEDIDALTSLDIHRSQQIRALADVTHQLADVTHQLRNRIETLEAGLRAVNGGYF